MKKVFFLILALGLFMGSVAFASLPVSPKSVVFLPGEVMVRAEQVGTPVQSEQGTWEYRLVLPGSVNQKSFYVTVNGQRQPFSWVVKPAWAEEAITDPAQETDAPRKVLLETFVKADKEKQELHSAIKGLEQARIFWANRTAVQNEKAPLSADELKAIGATIGQESEQLETALFEKKKALQDSERSWARAKEELAKYDAAHAVVEVAIPAMATLASASEAKRTVTLDYSYVLPAAVEASYVVSAEPEAGKLSLVQSVKLQQMSGIDWHDVDVSIAFVNKDYSLRPQAVRPWLLDYQAPAKAKLGDAMEHKAGVAAQRMRSMDEAMPEPVLFAPMQADGAVMNWGAMQKEMTSFRQWDLGKRSIANDSATTIDLASESYEAKYFYTLRPASERRGTLTAQLSFDKAQELPQGWANCFVDDIYMGSQRLNINGKEALVYLGTDPQVTIDTREVSMQKGEQGVFSKEQTREWHWQYTVNNSRSKAVDVVVQTAQPVSKDTSITITTKSKPEPQKLVPTGEDSDAALKLYVWEKTLEPAEIFVIDHQVVVGASVGKELTSKNK